MDLDAANAHAPVAGDQAERVAGGDAAAAQRAGHDQSLAARHEDAIDRQSDARPWTRRQGVADLDQARQQLLQPSPPRRRDGHHRPSRQRRRPEQVGERGSELGLPPGGRPLIVRGPAAGDREQVGLGDGHDAVAHPQQVEDLNVLHGLGADPVVGGDHEEARVALAGADQHVADEPVVARDVDEVDLRPVGERQPGVADVDRHAARPLLGEAVGVDPRERAQERRLAVVDVPGGAEDDAHRGTMTTGESKVSC